MMTNPESATDIAGCSKHRGTAMHTAAVLLAQTSFKRVKSTFISQP